MKRIENYLDNIFCGLPRTKEIQQLRQEMTDKLENRVTSLLAAGKNVDEAIGIAFSEVGNIEEICRSMGFIWTDEEKSKHLSDKDIRKAAKKKQKERENIIENIYGCIMILACIVFFLLGAFGDLWHPGWVILPICGLLCGLISVLTNIKK